MPDTAAQLKQRFAALAGDTAAGPTTLSIEDRDIAALGHRRRHGVVRVQGNLRGPRSQNDYIELARLYHTIFISNIPEFTAADEDAARRFIVLIDEFYDRGVKLWYRPPRRPAALYRGERLQLEFSARREPARRNADAAISRRANTVPEASLARTLA